MGFSSIAKKEEMLSVASGYSKLKRMQIDLLIALTHISLHKDNHKQKGLTTNRCFHLSFYTL